MFDRAGQRVWPSVQESADQDLTGGAGSLWRAVQYCPDLATTCSFCWCNTSVSGFCWVGFLFVFFFPFNKLPIRFFFNWSSQPNIYGRNDYDDIMCTTVELSYVLTFNCLSNRSDNFYLFGLGPSFSVEIFNRRMNHPPIINRIGVIVGLMSWRHSLALR